jgi:glycosyltransferase involved in cell wall biosynthesis
MEGVPLVSVVMSTYNRGALLGEAVESILAQAEPVPPFELLIVDNNSSDDTRAVVAALIARHGPRVRYLFEGRQGLSYGRNAGVAQSRGAIVAFTDDDIRVAPDWVSSIVRALDEYPDVDYVGGKVLPRWPSSPPAWLTSAHWAPLALTDGGDRSFMVDRTNPRCLVAASIGVRRTALDLVGGFDPAFQHNGRCSSVEDHDFQLRLWRRGRKGLYDPRIVVLADVQVDRMTKAHQRRWHRDHSRIAPYLYHVDEVIAQDQALVVRRPRKTLFGVPLWSYRLVMTTSLALALAWLRRDQSGAMSQENALREQVGWMRAQRDRRLRSTASFPEPRAYVAL